MLKVKTPIQLIYFNATSKSWTLHHSKMLLSISYIQLALAASYTNCLLLASTKHSKVARVQCTSLSRTNYYASNLPLLMVKPAMTC